MWGERGGMTYNVGPWERDNQEANQKEKIILGLCTW